MSIMKKFFSENGMIITVILVASLIVLSGCSNRQAVTDCVTGQPFGFWSGLWHGIIAPIDLIAMIWRNDVSVYATNNNGGWYALGFVLGSGGWGFFGGHGASRAKRRSRG
jgi:hypothetical protein